MTKAERLAIEAKARRAVAREFLCEVQWKRDPFPNGGPIHEFDLFAADRIIGGVTTGRKITPAGNSNTGARDRACSELLWLSLWPGSERRMHVLTDRPLADWLFSRFQRVPFPHEITIFHYDPNNDSLCRVGTISEPLIRNIT